MSEIASLPVVAAISMIVLAAVSVGFFVGSSVRADSYRPTGPDDSVTTFEPSPGWNTVTTTFGPNGDELSVAWAANVPFVSEEDLSGFPTETIRTLPGDGIVMTAIGPRPYTGGTSFPELREPLDLAQGFCAWDEYEGQPASNISKCLIDTIVDKQLLNVMVWFGTTEPTEEMLASADEELARLVLPRS